MISHNQRGVTMIELVISILVISITAFVLHPMLTEGLRAWNTVEENTQFTSEANAVWLYLGPLLANDSQITLAEDTQMTFTAAGNTYMLSTLPDGDTYTLILTQNGGNPQPLASDLARLDSPTRPGLALLYYDQEGRLTSTPNAVTKIDITLSLQGKTQIHQFQSFFRVEGRNMEMGLANPE